MSAPPKPKSDSEFGNALYMAYVAGELKLLRDYAAEGKPIPQEHVFVAGETIPMRVLVSELLGNHHRQQQQHNKGGRPHRVANKARDYEQAERNAAWLVAFELKGWRDRNGRKRVPGVKKNELIKAAIKEAAKAFKVPADTINEGNVRAALKNGRVVVP
jgi:hypothetical protein